MGKGDGKSRRGGDAQSPSSGFRGETFISHSSRRNAARGAYLEVIGPLQAAASGGAGRARVSQRRFHAQRVVPLPHGSSLERGEICDVPEFAPPHTCHEKLAPRDRMPKRSEAERFIRPFRERPARGWRHRQTSALKDAQSTLRARARAFPSRVLTSASGCTPPRTSDASPPPPPATPEIEDLIPIRRRPRQ